MPSLHHACPQIDVKWIGTDVLVSCAPPLPPPHLTHVYSIPKAYGSYSELVADPTLDAIYVATPNGLHGEWAAAALDAGKHVLCEKPFTANADEARWVCWVAGSISKRGGKGRGYG
jgi:hypothetical protein